MGLKGDPFAHFAVDRRGKKAISVSSNSFGLTHGGVGVAQQGLSRSAVCGRDGDADAGGDGEFPPIDCKRLGKSRQNPHGSGIGINAGRDIWKKNSKLITAKACNQPSFRCCCN